MAETTSIRAWIYQQFDADHSLAVPGSAYGGWHQHEATVDLSRLALVSMHAWQADPPDVYPGWDHAVEYRPRSAAIARDVYPPLLRAVRGAGIPVFHVGGGARDYYKDLPGHQRAVDLAGPPPQAGPGAVDDPSAAGIRELRRRHGFPGVHNEPDIQAGFAQLDFPAEARPIGDEGVAEDGHQLNALCRDAEVAHLVYVGFAINWCLLMSPGSMWEMAGRGYTCSAIREGVTAVENRESAATEGHKEEGLWRVSLATGLVFDLADFTDAVGRRQH
jgi:nicotinamidase-related amidase